MTALSFNEDLSPLNNYVLLFNLARLISLIYFIFASSAKMSNIQMHDKRTTNVVQGETAVDGDGEEAV